MFRRKKFNAVNPANALPPMIRGRFCSSGMLFNNLFYWCTNQSIIQRTLAAKNLAQAQRGAVFTAFLKLLDPFFITICGLLAYRFFGDGLANSDLAYPSLITTVVPNWLLGIIAAVLFGAILSSFNSALNSCVNASHAGLPRVRCSTQNRKRLSSGKSRQACWYRSCNRIHLRSAVRQQCIRPVCMTSCRSASALLHADPRDRAGRLLHQARSGLRTENYAGRTRYPVLDLQSSCR